MLVQHHIQREFWGKVLEREYREPGLPEQRLELWKEWLNRHDHLSAPALLRRGNQQRGRLSRMRRRATVKYELFTLIYTKLKAKEDYKSLYQVVESRYDSNSRT